MVKQLREFTGREGMEVVVKIMRPIGRLVRGKKTVEMDGKTVFEYFSDFFCANLDSAYELMAILSGENPETFSCTGGEMLKNISIMIGDPDLMGFFGFSVRTPETSESASESTEGLETSAASSNTAQNATNKK